MSTNITPDWYWSKGLHDAQIISYQTIELDYDYKQKNPYRNCLEIKLNPTHALMDNKVSSIKFYNFKCNNLQGLKDSWWMEDELTYNNKKYLLLLTTTKLNGELSKIEIFFDSAEVERKK